MATLPTPQAYGGTLSPDNLNALRKQGMTDDAIADEMAKSSPHFASQVSKIRKKFNGDPAATSAFLNTRFYGTTDYTPEAPPEKKGYVGRTLDRIYGAGLGLREDLDAYNRGETTAGQAVIRGGSEIFKGILSPATEAIRGAVGYGMEATGLDKVVSGVAQEVAQSDLGQTVAPYVKGAIEGYQNLPKSSGLRDLGAVASAGSDALEVYGAGQALNLGRQALKGAGTAIRHPIQTGKSLLGSAPATAGQSSDDVMRGLQGKAKEAVDKGVDERLVRFIGGRSEDERLLMKAMTREAERGTQLLGGTTKHKEIVGRQILRNAEHIIEERNRVGELLGSMTKAMAKDPVDLTDVSRQVFRQMSDKGVVFDSTGRKIVQAAGFADDEIPLLQKVADFFALDSRGRKIVQFKDGDMFRKKLFAELDLAKAKLAPTSGGQAAFSTSENLANKVRTLLLQKMGAKNPNYAKLAQAYAELSSEPAEFYKLLGYKGPLDDIGKEALGTGEKAMRVLGNASARPTEALKKLFAVSRKHGFESSVDEMSLIRYADELENIFPMAPTRALRGEAARAGSDVVRDVIQKKGLVKGAISTLDEKLMQGYEWARGLTPENRLKLLNELLDASPEESFLDVAREVLPTASVNAVEAGTKGVSAKEAIPAVQAAFKTGNTP